MMSKQRQRRRATGLVRSLIVSVATLAILLVCFAIYQYTQVDAPAVATQRKPRLPEKPTKPLSFEDDTEAAESSGVGVGQRGVIGPGERLKITVYQRDSDRARFEIEVDDLTPVTGSSNEFMLTSPSVRMRTKDGHAVRVIAKRGVIEAKRDPGGALDPQRGRLIGDVSIQYDRLSETDRAALPEAVRDRVDPAHLIEITMDEIEFDLEYAKLIVPGPLHLSASDVQLWATDLEVRFNEAENRVEHLRISRGGKIDLIGGGERFGLDLPGGEVSGRAKFTLVDWVRTSLEARLQTQRKNTDGADHAGKQTAAVTYNKDGVPVFRPGAEEETPADAPVRYHARFDGSVDARQMAGETARATLKADVLEILREFSSQDRSRVWSVPGTQSDADQPPDKPGNGRFVLTWTQRLVVDACAPGDKRCSGESPTRLTAVGSPVRLQRTGADVACNRMTYDPAASEMSLYGTATDPALARFDDRGAVSGVEIHSKRNDDEMTMRIAGPGSLTRGMAGIVPEFGTEDKRQGDDSVVSFSGALDVSGRLVTRPSLSAANLLSFSEIRVLDRAQFDGRVTVEQDDTQISADRMTVDFNSLPPLFGTRQSIRHVVGHGNVVLAQAADRLTCRDLDVTLASNRHRDAVPQRAVAEGDVLVEREDGSTIAARDKLVVDFVTESESTDASDPKARRSGMAVSRLQAFGDVAVQDPAVGLDLSADSMDCAVVNGSDIDSALILGTEDHPATVQLDTFTVTGREISLDVPRETATVPGAGRLTFRTFKDLDGRRTDEPIPVVVTWTDRMAYRGAENRAVFDGQVHAASQSTTTFDCSRLQVEFEDVAAAPRRDEGITPTEMVTRLVQRLSPVPAAPQRRSRGPRISKEPVYMLATGDAVALTAELDPTTGDVLSRTRIAGPKLSVNLRPAVSKMIIEGPGNLLLEDNRPAESNPASQASADPMGGLFANDADQGPSNTLIEWKELMWYDFGINQTRFEGDVSLKHFSGSALLELRPSLFAGGSEVAPGRSTYLNSDTLTVDFLERQQRDTSSEDRRMGRLSTERLEQFEATGSVRLRDEGEGLSLRSDRLVYWKDRDVLAVYGSAQRKAVVVIQRPGELPNQLSVERLFYNLKTGTWELKKPALTSR